MTTVVYSIEKDNDDTLVLERERLKAPSEAIAAGSAGVTVGPTGAHVAIVDAMAPKKQFMQRLEAVCIATGTTGGMLQLFQATGMSIPLKTFAIPKPPAVGDRYVWEFPTPVYNPTAVSPFHLQSTPSQLGSFFVITEGFYSNVVQDS